jgi:hypothetical protein
VRPTALDLDSDFRRESLEAGHRHALGGESIVVRADDSPESHDESEGLGQGRASHNLLEISHAAEVF